MNNEKREEQMSIREMLHFVSFQAKHFPQVRIFLFLGAVSGGITAYVNSFLYAGILNALLTKDYDAARRTALLLVGTVLLLGLLSTLSKFLYRSASLGSNFDTKGRTNEKSYTISFAKLEDEATIQKIQRIKNGENGHGSIPEQMDEIYQFFGSLVSIFCACGFLILLVVKSDFSRGKISAFLISTAVLLLAFALVLRVQRWASKKTGEESVAMFRRNEKNNTLALYLTELTLDEASAPDKVLYHLADYFGKKYVVIEKMSIGYGAFGIFRGKYSGLTTFSFELLAGVTYVVIALKAMTGSVSPGDVLMYAGAVITMMEAIRKASASRININYSNEYLKTYEEFINDRDMDYDGTLPVEKRTDNEYRLEFQNVSFRYPGAEDYVLKNINIKFRIGEKLALVGLNGAGKTTLIKLLLRLYEPTEGQILLNGIDIRLYDYREYMTIFGVVFQDYQLFDFPLDENIACSEEPDEKRIAEVLEKVGLTERVSKMKNGVHTVLSHETAEEGENLSGGEAQKVAIARALYKDAPFVILDEPTAALDPIAEAEIYENFRELVGDKTSIYISHRMSSCRFCDRIIVLSGGGIAEEGTHEDLLQAGGLYAELFNTQAQYYQTA